tara:strand:+ start:2150 stop:2677 length:528 start_codon:yes stop_codon:yes gene_type:complete
MQDRVPLHVIHLDQDDPRKCTARKMRSKGLVSLHESPSSAPRRGFLLDPKSTTILGPEDRALIGLGGSIVVLDCSWKMIDESLHKIRRMTRLEGRALPSLLAANPVSWGRIGRLSSAEALGASLAILGRYAEASIILEPFKFGHQFLELNEEPLEAYAAADSRDHIAELEKEFFE